MKKAEWFAEWFDTSYYHTLYQHRNDLEAKEFIERLVAHLSLKPGTKVLDLACGKGRHAVMFHKLGMDVLGVDLSTNSIQIAKENSCQGLAFDVHDMREVIPTKKFDLIANLFTSFGYFDTQSDNEKMIASIAAMLNEKGELIIDFMNAIKVIEHLVASEEKMIDGILFSITRRYDGQHIYKDISFEDNGISHHYTERVQALKQDDFLRFLAKDFEILSTFGNFQLDAFDPKNSDRLILLARRK